MPKMRKRKQHIVIVALVDKATIIVNMRARTTSQIDWWHARLTNVSLGGHAQARRFNLQFFGLGCEIIEI
jgi:hypothetical protein